MLLEASGAKGLLEEIADLKVGYPDYYQVPFHAYDRGNLCWEAAFEAYPATEAMALRVWPEENLSRETASDRLRETFHQVLDEYGPTEVNDVLYQVAINDHNKTKMVKMAKPVKSIV